MTEIIATHTFESAPSTSHAPNGCVSSVGEVTLHTVSIYEADYYGDGPKLYAKGHKRIRLAGSKQAGPRFGAWSDGHPERVKRWAEDILKAKRAEQAARPAGTAMLQRSKSQGYLYR